MATLKQKLAASKMSENIRNGKLAKPMGQILRESGYSESVCKHPDRVMSTNGFQKLIGQYIPEEGLTEKHSELLDAVTLGHFTFPNSMSDETIKEVIETVPEWILINVERNPKYAKANFSRPDNATRLKSLKLAYKLHGL